MGRFDKTAFGVLLSGALLVLGLSRWLTPSPDGVGTHTQLGLPPCGFLYLFGKPCPACGLTTAFAHLAHFELLESLRANPMGLPLFALTVLLVPVCVRGLVQKRPIAWLFDFPGIERTALTLALAMLVSWLARLVA